MLSLEEAKRQHRCRVCEKLITVGNGCPIGWQEEFSEMIYPLPVVILNFGKEFAHKSCLEELEDARS